MFHIYYRTPINWNNEVKQTAAHNLYEYMAKNLYLISSCTTSQSEPEGESMPANNKGTPAQMSKSSFFAIFNFSSEIEQSLCTTPWRA